MRVVVTGASGNVGTSLLPALAEEGVDEILGLARRRPDWDVAKVRWETADVTETDLRPLFEGADVVVHLAWLIQPSHDQVTLWQTNVTGTKRVLDAVGDVGVPKLVHASSVGAYSQGPKDSRVGEDHPTDGVPTHGYSWHKAYCERLLDAFEDEHPEVAVVRMRPALIFKREVATEIRRLFIGPFVPGALFDPRVVMPAVNRLPVRFQVVHSLDVARAYVAAVTRPVKGAFNVATEPPLGQPEHPPRAVLAPARWLTSTAWRARLVPVSPAWLDTAAAAPVMDTARATTELGWAPRYDAHETLADLLGGLRAGARGPTPPLR